ncbi:hypothetical protein EJV47_03355 [Hymenobacter gummosus]|uniref:Glycosyltransferase RgtA/B/C/D-like domain-containing protein n=1 Tax=Hymenobacter gummosus TaxID=1776032 RepID=A0A431UA01_9BACT|nr:hypothetical protein [Hymenobacter gummosus]RTQ53785.1 hypothetical protein EJV47_03355 [Hymenobacter gummosus]
MSFRAGFWTKRYSSKVYFAGTFVLYALYLLTTSMQVQHYDAGYYWGLAHNFRKYDFFSLYHFSSAFRGYLLPLLYYPLTVAEGLFLGAHTNDAIKVIGAAWAAGLFGVVAPKLWERVTGTTLGTGRRLLFVLLGFLFWRDHFNFLLSDFPAVLALLTALLATCYAPRAWAGLVAGACITAALYIRPISLLALPPLLLLLVWQAWRQRQPGRSLGRALLTTLSGFALSFALVALPQYLINRNNFARHSPFVLGLGDGDEFKINGVDNLYLFQLNEGLQLQKYESNVGQDYSKLQVFYLDPAGRNLLAQTQAGRNKFDTYGKYFRFVARYPCDMAALYTRHIFNGLDVLYPGPYLERVLAPTLPVALPNYLVLFLAAVVLVARGGRVRPWQWLLLAALLVTCAGSVPTVIECRFFLPLHLLVYALVSFGWPASWTWSAATREQRLGFGLAGTMWVLVCLVLSASTQMALEVQPKTLQRLQEPTPQELQDLQPEPNPNQPTW